MFPPEKLATGLTKLLGIQFVEASGEQVVATMPVTSDHHQPMGYLHGGASVALAETVVSVGGTLRVMHEGKACMGMEINANHLRPVKSGILKAVATPVYAGKSTQVWEAKLYDEAEKMICICRCTLAVVQIDR
ncbi:MAG: hotdog fold thioesterase [Bacteroidetes Order II. Incertae sedis bacterium]|nr:hotdog fold thioesterase [Bacteroidetes Order II. bacterium]